LRAIGSDEVERLAQLLNAGMDSSMEVANKTLVGWAVEMDAKYCCELFYARLKAEGMEEEEEAKSEEEVAITNDEAAAERDSQATKAVVEKKVNETAAPQPPTIIQDERLTNLSLSDIQTLTSENLNLIPHLTTCQNDLRAETSIYQSILRDVESTGGKGGLSSQSLLELVRSLKDQRVAVEEAAQAWQGAWEEREDELDFFWEEVLDERLREELAGLLHRVDVQVADPLMQGVLSRGDVSTTMEECARQFLQVDNHVNTLRSSIASLAEESAQYVSEIERHGMSGALSLTRSLREEVKEMESNLNEARLGEGIFRRKIEIIQRRLGHANDGDSGSQEGYVDAPMREGEDGMEDYQLRSIVQQQQQEQQQQRLGEERGNSSPLVEPEHHAEQEEMPTTMPEGHGVEQHASAQENNDSPKEAQYKEDDAMLLGKETLIYEEKHLANNALIDSVVSDDSEDEISEQDSSSQDVDHDDIEESVDETNDIIEVDEMEMEKRLQAVVQEIRVVKESLVNAVPHTPDENGMNGGDAATSDLNSVGGQALKTNVPSAGAGAVTVSQPLSADFATTATNDHVKKPSDAIMEGMSTAIVVHTPDGQAGSSISSQIWDILRRIVGLSRAHPSAAAGAYSLSQSYHDAENHPHIMIV